MSYTGSAWNGVILDRIANPSNVRLSTSDTYVIMDHVQKTVNAITQDYLASASFTIPAGRTVFVNTEVNAACWRPMQITVGGRTLKEVPWRQLGRSDPRWLRRVGRRSEQWARFGMTHFAIVPMLEYPETATVTYLSNTTTMSSSQNTQVSDIYFPIMCNLAVALIALRHKDFEFAADNMRMALEQLRAVKAGRLLTPETKGKT